jgi:hypothetical protein
MPTEFARSVCLNIWFPGNVGAAGRLLHMDLATAIVLVLVVVVVPALLVGGMFVWAAVKDGHENRALHKRLGIRRGTRLGR